MIERSRRKMAHYIKGIRYQKTSRHTHKVLFVYLKVNCCFVQGFYRDIHREWTTISFFLLFSSNGISAKLLREYTQGLYTWDLKIERNIANNICRNIGLNYPTLSMPFPVLPRRNIEYSVLKNLENRKHLRIKHCKVYLEKVLLVTPSNWIWRTWLNFSYKQKLIMIRKTLKLRWSWSRQIWNINTCALWRILNITWS